MCKDVSNESFEVRSFGEKFKELRKNAGLKQVFFESKGYRKNSLSMFENDKRRPSLQDRKKLVGIVQKATDLVFDYDYYYTSAEEALEIKVAQYEETLYDNQSAFERAVCQALSLKMLSLVTNLYYEKGKNLYSQRKFRDSIREYMNALKYVNTPKSVRPEIYKSLADSFQILNELSACELYLQLAIDINKTDHELRYRCLYALAKVYIDLKDNDRCEEVLNIIYNENDNSVKRLYADMVRASLYRNSGDLDKAINFSREKLEASSVTYHEFWLHNLSFYCSENGDYYKAIEYLKRTLEVRKDKIMRSMSQNMLADTYIKIDEFDKAETILDEIYGTIIEAADMFHILRWFENKIKILERKNRYDETEGLMKKILEVGEGYSELKIWYIERIQEIINCREEKGDERGKHYESIRLMMSYM